jgi:hypothetical protein
MTDPCRERRYTVTMDVNDLIARLDAAGKHMHPYAHLHLQAAHTIRELMASPPADRKAVLEECAEVADTFRCDMPGDCNAAPEIAAAIRALGESQGDEK